MVDRLEEAVEWFNAEYDERFKVRVVRSACSHCKSDENWKLAFVIMWAAQALADMEQESEEGTHLHANQRKVMWGELAEAAHTMTKALRRLNESGEYVEQLAPWGPMRLENIQIAKDAQMVAQFCDWVAREAPRYADSIEVKRGPDPWYSQRRECILSEVAEEFVSLDPLAHGYKTALRECLNETLKMGTAERLEDRKMKDVTYAILGHPAFASHTGSSMTGYYLRRFGAE